MFPPRPPFGDLRKKFNLQMLFAIYGLLKIEKYDPLISMFGKFLI